MTPERLQLRPREVLSMSMSLPSCPRLVSNRVAMVAILALLRLSSWHAAAIAQTAVQKPPAVKAVEKTPAEKWEASIREFEAADKGSPPPKGAVLFIGASS